MGRISPGPTRWPPGAEKRLVPAKSNLKPQTSNPKASSSLSQICVLQLHELLLWGGLLRRTGTCNLLSLDVLSSR